MITFLDSLLLQWQTNKKLKYADIHNALKILLEVFIYIDKNYKF